MTHFSKVILAGIFICIPAAAWALDDDLNGRYRITSYTINQSGCNAEGDNYRGYENTVVKIFADKNLTVPSGESLQLFNCTDENDPECAVYWGEWMFETKNSDGSWSSDFSRSISKGTEPNTCSMLYTIRTITRSMGKVIMESRSYSTLPFEYVTVAPSQADCTDTALVPKYKNLLSYCSLYTRAVLTPV